MRTNLVLGLNPTPTAGTVRHKNLLRGLSQDGFGRSPHRDFATIDAFYMTIDEAHAHAFQLCWLCRVEHPKACCIVNRTEIKLRKRRIPRRFR